MIAARLAVRLGLERVYPVDDQSDDAGPGFMADFVPYVGPLYEAMREDPRAAPFMQSAERMTTPAETLATYRMFNTPAAGQFDADFQWLPCSTAKARETWGAGGLLCGRRATCA